MPSPQIPPARATVTAAEGARGRSPGAASPSLGLRRHPAAARAGVAYGLAAYLWWGFVPVYFKAVAHVPAAEILAHRVVWSFLLLMGLAAARGSLGDVRAALGNRRTAATLVVTALLVATNWFVFIWAVARGLVLQASLGYFINPLVNVLLGFAFLGERLRRAQTVSVVLATSGVVLLTVSSGRPPWVALALAGSFGVYGLLRKTAPVAGIPGLAVETLALLPLALGGLLTFALRGQLVFGHGSLVTDLLLVFSGVITALPLVWFANAARRLRLATLGFLQYLAPSLHFLLAVIAYGEPFGRAQLVTFACIWSALALYSFDTARAGARAPEA